MRLRYLITIGALRFLPVLAALAANSSQASLSREDLKLQLPQCARECADLLACGSDGLSCVCTEDIPADVQICVLSNCSIRSSYVTKRLYSDACGIPPREYSYKVTKPTWILFTIAAFAVLLRFISRSQTFGGVGLGWDDWIILGCLAPSIAHSTLLTLAAHSGLGEDVWRLLPSQVDDVIRYLYIIVFLYTSILVGVQVSITVFYIRIFGDAHRTFRAICIGIIALCIAYGTGACIGALFYCNRIPHFWQDWDGENPGSCRTANAQIYTMAGINIFLDLTILILPIPRLRNLNVTLAKKIGLAATFLIGIMVTGISIVRLRYIIVWGNTLNPTWEYNRVATVSTIECQLAIICACMPSMTGLGRRLWREKKRKSQAMASKTRSTSPASTSKEALCQGTELAPRRTRGSSMRVTTSLAEFLTVEDGAISSEDLELRQRGVDHANAEIARFKALGAY